MYISFVNFNHYGFFTYELSKQAQYHKTYWTNLWIELIKIAWFAKP